MTSVSDFLKLVAAGVLCCLLLGCGPAGDAAGPPNFVFILADDLGWADLGSYGSTFYETPNLDRLATEGVRFTNAYAACPVCSPTRVSIMTGKYPARVHLTDWIPGRQNREDRLRFMKMLPPEFEHQMALEETTLAEALKEAGYATGFTGKWHLGRSEEFDPEYQGFDLSLGDFREGEHHGRADRQTDAAIEFIRDHQNEPFLMYLSYNTVHMPFHGKPELVKKYEAKARMLGLDKVPPFAEGLPWMDRPDPGLWKERVIQSSPDYAAMVEAMDDNVGRVLETLEEIGIAENTVVIFMGDNGGLSTAERSPTSNLPLRAGKGWLYEGGVREPLIIRWPGHTRAGLVCDEVVTSTDFYPTMLEMAGVAQRPEQHVDGVSIMPLLDGSGSLGREAAYWHYPHYSNQGDLPGGAVRVGDLKLIEYFEDMHVELYDLSTDLSETRDLSTEMPERANELREMLHQWRQQVDAHMPTPNPGYDPSER